VNGEGERAEDEGEGEAARVRGAGSHGISRCTAIDGASASAGGSGSPLDGVDRGDILKVLPIRLTGGEPPALLADIKYPDLIMDWDKELKELLAAIR